MLNLGRAIVELDRQWEQDKTKTSHPLESAAGLTDMQIASMLEKVRKNDGTISTRIARAERALLALQQQIGTIRRWYAEQKVVVQSSYNTLMVEKNKRAPPTQIITL